MKISWKALNNQSNFVAGSTILTAQVSALVLYITFNYLFFLMIEISVFLAAIVFAVILLLAMFTLFKFYASIMIVYYSLVDYLNHRHSMRLNLNRYHF